MSMNHAYFISDRNLTVTEANRLRDILLQSQCPNESLRATFGDFYKGVNEKGEYIFGEGPEYSKYVLEY